MRAVIDNNNIPKWYISALLIIVGIVLHIVVGFFTFFFVLIRIIKKDNTLPRYLMDCSHVFSQAGNVWHQDFFNTWFWKRSGAKSGDIDESVSSVTGKNEYMSTLKPLGKALRWILDKLDQNHSYDAIELDEGDKINMKQ